ncbi:MAG TPA: phosphatase PAP2 family protein [Gammaproteobacteria bacterium]|nr:phosphatase PAP2 family protein [Gammaproteobacteria bacterium]
MAATTAALAQQDDEPGRVRAVVSDVKGYVTAPLHAERKQWVRFGAALGAVAVAYQLDDDVRDHFGTVTVPVGTSADTHDARDAAPAALAVGGTWLAAVLSDQDDGKREAGAMLESAAFSGVAAYALKQLAGRERPYVTADESDWGGDGEAFPSVHTAAAFAIGTVLAESGNERHRWLRRTLGYGLAVGTAYARMDHGAHWLSDTVAGAGLGIATARFVMKQSDERARRARFGLVPSADGVAIGYTVDLRP